MPVSIQHQRSANRTLRIVCPNGHLGFAPIKTGSFEIGAGSEPDLICANSGSCDIGPGPLGADVSSSPLAWQTHDLEHMLLACASSRRADDHRFGRRYRHQQPRRSVRAASSRSSRASTRLPNIPRRLVPFRSAEIANSNGASAPARSSKVWTIDRRSTPPRWRQPTASSRWPACIHTSRCSNAGADVIIGGRSSDCAIFAAPAMRAGFPEALAYYYGKVLECASFCAEPYAGKESVLGEITMDDVKVTALLPAQRCTIASVAGHAMYERANPFTEYVLGGELDMSDCVYEQYDERTCRITGPRFVPANELQVKLEGAGKIGERYVGMVGVRDPVHDRAYRRRDRLGARPGA